MSAVGYQFLGGVMRSAADLCLIFNPTVNSFGGSTPRSPPRERPGANTITYRQQPHPHGAHPGAGRFEFRLMDGATNPIARPRC